LRNGDLLCVFYSGYDHVSTPNEKWPRGGRLMAVRSSDNGQTWGKPVISPGPSRRNANRRHRSDRAAGTDLRARPGRFGFLHPDLSTPGRRAGRCRRRR
jgi:hypothetical protein